MISIVSSSCSPWIKNKNWSKLEILSFDFFLWHGPSFENIRLELFQIRNRKQTGNIAQNMSSNVSCRASPQPGGRRECEEENPHSLNIPYQLGGWQGSEMGNTGNQPSPSPQESEWQGLGGGDPIIRHLPNGSLVLLWSSCLLETWKGWVDVHGWQQLKPQASDWRSCGRWVGRRTWVPFSGLQHKVMSRM